MNRGNQINRHYSSKQVDSGHQLTLESAEFTITEDSKGEKNKEVAHK
jgi:hypothetical protein